ncbi:MAG: sigma-70 family RNA polymerase sigma factor [Candidatus Kapaibacterium sp.]
MNYLMPHTTAFHPPHSSHRFTMLMRDARPMAEAFARRLCRSTEETKDLMQDAAAVSWKYFPQLHDETQFSALMLQIIKQQYLYRKRTEERHRPFVGEFPDGDFGAPDDRGDISQELKIDLHEALGVLNPEEREIVLLKWAGFTLEELSQVYECKFSCMNMRLRRARGKMQDSLQKDSSKRGSMQFSSEYIIEEATRLAERVNLKLERMRDLIED